MNRKIQIDTLKYFAEYLLQRTSDVIKRLLTEVLQNVKKTKGRKIAIIYQRVVL